MVFTEETIIDDREKNGEWTLLGNAVMKLKRWQESGGIDQLPDDPIELISS